jgi:S-DNA-T family DNA segregation ATPase FtsK/SpoIIIE
MTVEVETAQSLPQENESDAIILDSDESEAAPVFEIIPSQAEPDIDIKINSVDTLVPSSMKISQGIPSDKIWEYPPDTLLAEPPVRSIDTSDIDKKIKIIKDTLKSFGIDVGLDMENVKVGSTVTQYALKPRSAINVSKISTLQGNLALALASPTGTVRVEAPIPGKSLVGIEVPNTKRTMVYFKSLISSQQMKSTDSKLSIALGEDVGGRVITYDIGKMPHLLIAGTTGSGKSIFIHNVLSSILFRATPQEVKFILIDPKRVELILYEGIPHLLTPVVTDMEKSPSVFRWAVEEMERRYKLFEKARVKNIDTYNAKSGIQVMPYLVIVVDELGEIMIQDPAGVEKSIIRLAQMGRATGIHLILAVQRPSTEVITGLIKANIPCRVAFQVLNQIDSRVIIDQTGAEKLLGKGDMLFVPPDTMKPVRLQGAFISEKETADLVDFLKGQGLEPDYEEEVLNTPVTSTKGGKVKSSWGDDVDDDLFDEAVAIVVSAKKASSSLLQRKLSIGFARASRLIDMMEDRGIVGGEAGGSRGREVLIDDIPDDSDLSKFKEDSDFGFDAEDFSGENFPRNRLDD